MCATLMPFDSPGPGLAKLLNSQNFGGEGCWTPSELLPAVLPGSVLISPPHQKRSEKMSFWIDEEPLDPEMKKKGLQLRLCQEF